MLSQGWQAASLLLPGLQRATAVCSVLARELSGVSGAGFIGAQSPQQQQAQQHVPQQQQHQQQLTTAPPSALEQRRGFALAIARKLEGRSYNLRNDVVQGHFDGLADYLIKVVPKWIKFGVAGPPQSNDTHNELTVYTTPETLLPLARFLRDHVNTQFKCLIDVTAVDFPERPARFEVVYHLLSPRWNNRIRIKVCVDEVTPVPSICSVYPAANWFERETWDMFGVFFKDHPDMRRILTDYGFTGHPLRKDFPLSGYTEVRYDYAKKRVVSEPLELSQEFRYFDFQSPWDTLPR
ncbi:NADH dehydrogenase (ubiquinone) Fe-S protein [Monoraphidium neglectum]|uniref:NADH dehydrogenase (Ubiquinone) Fe-S protein n=1 Tax=Monoraphidium neglectum TaxID=145388 RepID=A0A0D2NDC9_9CHLO|nr:NADH dehydrogenase (ubiquinone) Fe-S protein [Monoraphidium neglectum]KIZ03326.1 NADH dehydrogenase (ubiquinone) Fe-S protein [Monoraphidium neglectum]|eukprot:XP_013902345.1 NADH dehydrogenase (ubiquinone) Fe-S protein [Monoraphidium neglectum]